MVAGHGVKRGGEHHARARTGGDEGELAALEASFSGGVVGHARGGFSGEGLDGEAAPAGVAGVSDGEGEDVPLSRDGTDDLRECALFAADELDGAAALGNGKVVGVDVLDGLQGLDDPAWQRAVSVFDVGWDYHSP